MEKVEKDWLESAEPSSHFESFLLWIEKKTEEAREKAAPEARQQRSRRKMGYELTRFQGDVDEELVCPICAGVLEEPLQAAVCEHAFCRACITEWLSRQPTCPVDRNAITTTNLRPVPRILKNLLARYAIPVDMSW